MLTFTGTNLDVAENPQLLVNNREVRLYVFALFCYFLVKYFL